MNRDFKWLKKLEKNIKKSGGFYKPKKKKIVKAKLEHPSLDLIREKKLLREKQKAPGE